MNIDVRRLNLFATPVAVLPMPGAEALCAALKDDILAGGQTGRETADVVQAAAILVAAMTGRAEDEDPARWDVSTQFHIVERGQSVAVHSHPGIAWEATCVVDIATGEPGGEIEFQDPRGPGPVMYSPHFTYDAPDGETIGVSRGIVVQPGTLVVYPAWMLHAVGFYRGETPRLSLTVRFTPAPGAGRGSATGSAS